MLSHGFPVDNEPIIDINTEHMPALRFTQIYLIYCLVCLKLNQTSM